MELKSHSGENSPSLEFVLLHVFLFEGATSVVRHEDSGLSSSSELHHCRVPPELLVKVMDALVCFLTLPWECGTASWTVQLFAGLWTNIHFV